MPQYHTYTDEELVRSVDNDPTATPRERELAERLNATLTERNDKPIQRTFEDDWK